MALQSTGSISFSQIQAEFGGSGSISLSEYYVNQGLVPNDAFCYQGINSNIPFSGPISLGNFRGTTNGNGLADYTAGNYTWTAPTNVRKVTVYLVGAGGGGTSANGLGGGGGGSGGYCTGQHNVVGGGQYSVSVGSGGAGGVFNNGGKPGGNGGGTFFSNLRSAGGGGTGYFVSGQAIGFGGAGGGGCTLNGNNGFNGGSRLDIAPEARPVFGGYGGASVAWGYGGGGMGGNWDSRLGNRPGGAGVSGYARIRY